MLHAGSRIGFLAVCFAATVGGPCRGAEAGTLDTGAAWLEAFGSYELFGFAVWRLATALLIILLALAINTALRYALRRREKEADEAEAEAAAGPVPIADRKSLLGFIIRSAESPLRLAIWGAAARGIGPVLQLDSGDSAWAAQLIFSLAVALFIYKLVDVVEYFLNKLAAKTDNRLDDMLVPAARKSLRVLVVIIAGLHIYNSLTGQPITTLLAGLGLGGLAFALAAQDTIKNLFGFFMILADQPFVVGERVDLCGHDGVVESVGFRSTRIRRLDGHLVTIPNGNAANDVVHNIGRRPYIKRVMNVTITYDTPLEKVEKAVEILRAILDNHEGMDPEFPPRVYFNELNSDSLNILALYWYHPPDYWAYLDHAQRINLELMRCYEAEGIEFAFPTQTLYLAGDPNRELVLQHLDRNA